ncbi:MAG TPA: thiamine pyrophosphate-binding protein [Candidatus Dormibacteraeota bacterium]|nr:thiamine pyrophosphate-binding protein [Candidatus Dormibacteraeota bacterium]
MKPRMALGDFLVAYLQCIGVTHLFGIPGDLVMRLFLRFGRKRGLQIVTMSHEPGVGFAADGYARATGRIGVICVTYGAGGHNMVNPTAGSFAERVPLLVISGGPGEEERKLGTLIHHQAKEIESQLHIYRELTCAARLIDHPGRAADEIDEVVRAVWAERRPGYLEIHRDMVERVIQVPERLLEWNGRLPERRSDARKVREAAREVAARLNAARAPVVIAGIECHRYHATRELLQLVERTGAPCATTVLAKGAIPIDHPQHMGVYIGAISPRPIRERVAGADVVLSLGTLLTDMNLMGRGPTFGPEEGISAVDDRVDVSFHSYNQVTLRDFLAALLRQRLKRRRERVAYADNLTPQQRGAARAVRVSDVLWEVNRFLDGRRDIMVVAEAGDALFGGLDVRVGGPTPYLAQGYYASMGFGVPGAIGAQIGTGRRPLVLCGDGAFQMTGPEIAQAPRHGCNPIVLLLNNAGWGIFRPVADRKDLLAIPPWPYAELGRAWGGWGARVETVAELRAALAEAGRRSEFALVEVILDPDDHSPVARKYIAASVGRGAKS